MELHQRDGVVAANGTSDSEIALWVKLSVDLEAHDGQDCKEPQILRRITHPRRDGCLVVGGVDVMPPSDDFPYFRRRKQRDQHEQRAWAPQEQRDEDRDADQPELRADDAGDAAAVERMQWD